MIIDLMMNIIEFRIKEIQDYMRMNIKILIEIIKISNFQIITYKIKYKEIDLIKQIDK